MLGALNPLELIQDYISNKDLVSAHELADSLSKKQDTSAECILWEYHLKRSNYADASFLKRYLAAKEHGLAKVIEILTEEKVSSLETL
jgi:hypothetical protein